MSTFDGVIEFVAVAETQSFSAASRQLGVSTSHVSRQVARLESRVGAALFARTTRKVSLTPIGYGYYQHCAEMVRALEYADDQLKTDQSSLKGTIRISAAGAFAENYVSAALVEFALQHPDVTIDLDFNSQIVDLSEGKIDFAIRYGRLKDSGLVARKLVDRSMMMAASREYLDKFGEPTKIEHLQAHNCIISNNDVWTLLNDNKEQKVKVSGTWKSNNAGSVVAACSAGLGLAYMPKSSYLDTLDRGDVIPVLKHCWAPGTSSWIVYQNRKFLPVRVRAAIDYLLGYFQDWNE